MNKQRRKQVEQVLEQIEELMGVVEELQEQEQESYDNIPENLQESDRAQAIYDWAEALEAAFGSLEEAKDYIEDQLNNE